MTVKGLLLSLAVGMGSAGAVRVAEDPAYRRQIEDWRAQRETDLKKDDSWLTVAGLYWLRDGENSVGSDPTNDFVLPERSAPPVVGRFRFDDGKTRFEAAPGVTVAHQGESVTNVDLAPGEKNAIVLGRLSMWVHPSGPRLAIRLRDLDSSIRKQFEGLTWFPVDSAYRVMARFHPYAEPKEVEILNMLGDIERYKSTGTVEFELGGETIVMEPVLNTTEDGLWLIFRDGTSGKETYPAARFLHTDLPVEGRVVVDFNKAYNPPCAFNPHTTCPMPSKQNRLKVRIEAGEKDYHKKQS